MRELELPVLRHDRVHARGRHGARGREDARSRHLAAIDGELHVHVGEHRAFRFDIAQRREAVLERQARIPRGEDGAVGDRLVEQLLIVGFGGGITLQQQMRMGIDQPGQNGHLGQIDDARGAGLRLHLRQRADRLDPVSFDQDAHVGLGGGGASVDQASGLDEYGRWWWCCGRRLSGKGCRQHDQEW